MTTVHACPVGDDSSTPCCGRMPGELFFDRMTLLPELVTCGKTGWDLIIAQTMGLRAKLDAGEEPTQEELDQFHKNVELVAEAIKPMVRAIAEFAEEASKAFAPLVQEILDAANQLDDESPEQSIEVSPESLRDAQVIAGRAGVSIDQELLSAEAFSRLQDEAMMREQARMRSWRGKSH